MHSLRSSLLIAALGIALSGCSSSQTTGPASTQNPQSPDQQFADLKLKYESLNDKERRGEQGRKLMADLASISDKLSDQAKLEAGKLVAAYKMMQPTDGAHFEGPKLPDPNAVINPKDGTFPLPFDPKFPERALPDLSKLPLDPSKFPGFPTLDPSKLPAFPTLDPSKFPDLPKLDPSNPPKLDPSKFPDLPFPKLDPSKIPDLPKLDPTKIPDLKIPPPLELKIPELPKKD